MWHYRHKAKEWESGRGRCNGLTGKFLFVILKNVVTSVFSGGITLWSWGRGAEYNQSIFFIYDSICTRMIDCSWLITHSFNTKLSLLIINNINNNNYLKDWLKNCLLIVYFVVWRITLMQEQYQKFFKLPGCNNVSCMAHGLMKLILKISKMQKDLCRYKIATLSYN